MLEEGGQVATPQSIQQVNADVNMLRIGVLNPLRAIMLPKNIFDG